MSSPISNQPHTHHAAIRFGGVPEIQRNLSMAAQYLLLNDEYSQQRREAFLRGDQWGARVSRHFEDEAHKAKAHSDGLIEASVADPDIHNYLEGAEKYNLQPLATRITGMKLVRASEPPKIGANDTFIYTYRKMPSNTQSLSRFFSTKGLFMAGKSQEDITRIARNLVESISIAMERRFNPKAALGLISQKPELLEPFCKSLAHGIPGFDLSVALPDSVKVKK